MIDTNRIADVFVEVADTLVGEFDVIDFLHSLAVRTSELTGTSAVGLLLTDLDGGLNQVAASSEDAEILELLQLQHSEGPCVDCHRTGHAIVEEDLAGATQRWPTFAPRAVAAGISSVHAFPMRLRADVIGALNVFGRPGDAIAADDVRLIQSLADVATIAILHERALSRAELLTEQLQFALNSRIVIEQAKGAVARALHIGVEEAFAILRLHARSNRMRLTEVARAVIDDRAAMDTLARPKK